MSTCKTCKHWGDAESNRIAKLGECRAVPHLENAMEWVEEGDDYVNTIKREYVDRLAFAVDGSGYWAALLTHEDFGCVQYEDKK